MANPRLPVLATAAEVLALMWRHLLPAILFTVVVTMPVEWAVDVAGLRHGGDAPLALVAASLISVVAAAWLSAAYLRVVAVREAGGVVGLATALFEQLDCLPWLCLNLLAVTVALLAAMVVVSGLLAVVVVTTLLPLGLLDHPGSVGLGILLFLLVMGSAGAVWIGSLAVRWSLVTPVVVLEGRRWALERSSDLTRGQRWRCMEVMAVTGAVLVVPLLLVVVAAIVSGGAPEVARSLASGGNLASQTLFGFTGLLFANTGYRLLALLAAGDDRPLPAGEAAVAIPGGGALQEVALKAAHGDHPDTAPETAAQIGGHEADEAAEPPTHRTPDAHPDE